MEDIIFDGLTSHNSCAGEHKVMLGTEHFTSGSTKLI